MRAAIRKAANIVRRDQRKRIKRHQSAKTGTSELWTDKAEQRNRDRVGLYKSIIARVRYDKQTMNIIASVGPGYYDAWIGWFFEMGRAALYWGRNPVNASEIFPPEPFVRPSGEETKQQQTAAVVAHTKANWEKS
jgi:hypothetical protein